MFFLFQIERGRLREMYFREGEGGCFRYRDIVKERELFQILRERQVF